MWWWWSLRDEYVNAGCSKTDPHAAVLGCMAMFERCKRSRSSAGVVEDKKYSCPNILNNPFDRRFFETYSTGVCSTDARTSSRCCCRYYYYYVATRVHVVLRLGVESSLPKDFLAFCLQLNKFLLPNEHSPHSSRRRREI